MDLLVKENHRRQGASADAGHGVEAVFQVRGRLTRFDTHLPLEFREDALTAADVAGGAAADLNDVAAGRLELELGKEGSHAVNGALGEA